MTVLLVAAGVIVGLAALAYYGSRIGFHPPKMTALTVWPDQFQLSYETVEFRTSDGLSLKGWFIPASRPTDKTALMCHGWGDNKGDLLKSTHFLASRDGGLNLLYFDHRSHGESAGTFTTIGCLEARDFDAALAFLKDRKPSLVPHLGAYGLSMGACVAIAGTARHPEIRAAVCESPYASFNEVVRQWTWNNLWVPYFPMIPLVLGCIRLRLGEDPEASSPIYHAGRIAPRPVLIIGAERDDLMPPGQVQAVFDHAREPRELWFVPGAEHAKCFEVAPEEYQSRISGFFQRYL